MEDNRKGKVTGIRQIVRLKGFLQKWQNVTLGPKRSNNRNRHPSSPSPSPSPSTSSPTKALLPNARHPGGDAASSTSPAPGGISPAISKRLMSYNSYCDSDEDGWQSPEPPCGVPRGYLAVYVGPELRRFIIPTTYLGDPLFKVLLEKVEEEFGFDHSGALTIPCETETFKYLLKCMENHQREQHTSAGTSYAMEE